MKVRPSWWRVFARRRWNRERRNEWVESVSTPHPDAFLESMRHRLRDRSARLRSKLNTETDTECVAADAANGVPFFAILRSMRNRGGEQ